MITLVNGMVLAIDGIPVLMDTTTTLLPPTIAISDLTQENPDAEAEVSILISNCDPAGTGIRLFLFSRTSSRAVVSYDVANANGTVDVSYPSLADGETLWCRAMTLPDSNPSEAVTETVDLPDTGATIPIVIPFTVGA